jgi:hypothetical protein
MKEEKKGKIWRKAEEEGTSTLKGNRRQAGVNTKKSETTN